MVYIINIIYKLCLNSDYILESNNQFLLAEKYYSIFSPFLNILEGIRYLNKNKYIHGDLKYNNIVLDRDDNKMKLIDLDNLIGFGKILPYNALYHPMAIIRIINKSLSYTYEENWRDLYINVKNKYKIFPMEYLNLMEKIYDQTTYSDAEENLIELYNENIKEIGKIKASEDLYKRIDIFSLGFLLLDEINLLKYKLPKEIILKLEPFIEMCLVQKKTCPKYKTLIKIYEDFLEEIK